MSATVIRDESTGASLKINSDGSINVSGSGAGVTIYHGTGAPASWLGNAGDFYIDDQNLFIYGPKQVTGWGSGANMVGPIGPTSPINIFVAVPYASWTITIVPSLFSARTFTAFKGVKTQAGTVTFKWQLNGDDVEGSLTATTSPQDQTISIPANAGDRIDLVITGQTDAAGFCGSLG